MRGIPLEPLRNPSDPSNLQSPRNGGMPALPIHTARPAAGQKQLSSGRKIFIYITSILLISWAIFSLIGSTSSNPSISTMASQKPLPEQSDPSPQTPPHEDDDPSTTPSSSTQTLRPDLIRVQDLPQTYVPETGKHRSSGRLVIVGDVHGMKHSLLELLSKISFDKKHDHLILAGDMISKGPHSKGVVDLAMKLGASGVRGNHEDRIVLAHASMNAQQEEVEEDGVGSDEEPDETSEDEDEDENLGKDEVKIKSAAKKDRKLVKKLGEKRIKWLKKLPVILRVGFLGEMGEVVVVHAGLEPGVELQKQDIEMVMNMRTIGDDGVPSEEHDGKGWMKAWNKYQKTLPEEKRTTVIYGHDSKRGLVKEKYSFGIDTGCLKGGKLTAMVIEGGPLEYTHKIEHVDCKDHRGR